MRASSRSSALALAPAAIGVGLTLPLLGFTRRPASRKSSFSLGFGRRQSGVPLCPLGCLSLGFLGRPCCLGLPFRLKRRLASSSLGCLQQPLAPRLPVLSGLAQRPWPRRYARYGRQRAPHEPSAAQQSRDFQQSLWRVPAGLFVRSWRRRAGPQGSEFFIARPFWPGYGAAVESKKRNATLASAAQMALRSKTPAA